MSVQRHPGLYMGLPQQALPVLPMGSQMHRTIQYLQPDAHLFPRVSVAPGPLVGSSGAQGSMAQEHAYAPVASAGSAVPRIRGQPPPPALHFLPSHQQGFGAAMQPMFAQQPCQMARAGMHIAAPLGSFYPCSVDQGSHYPNRTGGASDVASPSPAPSAQLMQTPQQRAAQAVAQQMHAAQQLSGPPHAQTAQQMAIDALLSSERLAHQQGEKTAGGVGSAASSDDANQAKRRNTAADGRPAGEPRKRSRKEPTVVGVVAADGVTVTFPCSKCEKSFESRAALSGHTRFCSGGMWRCEWCECKETETPSKVRVARQRGSPQSRAAWLAA
jgi:hypothetical protein